MSATVQAVHAGAKFFRRAAPILRAAAATSSSPVAFFGGALSGLVGLMAGAIGAGTTGELLRTALAQLAAAPEAPRPHVEEPKP